MFNLNKHLDSDEKIVLFFRPSRKAYILQYLLFIGIIVASIFFFVYFWSQKTIYLTALSYLLVLIIIFSLIHLLRIEYRIWSRKYALTDERLMYSKGIFSEKYKSARYAYVTDIDLNQTIWDKIMNTGTLVIDTAGTDEYEIRYRKVSDPFKIKRTINDLTSEKKSQQPLK